MIEVVEVVELVFEGVEEMDVVEVVELDLMDVEVMEVEGRGFCDTVLVLTGVVLDREWVVLLFEDVEDTEEVDTEELDSEVVLCLDRFGTTDGFLITKLHGGYILAAEMPTTGLFCRSVLIIVS